MRRICCCLPVVAFLLACAPAAQAADLSIDPVSGVATYDAGVGEVNDVTISVARGYITVADPGAPRISLSIVGGAILCDKGPSSLTCPATGVRSLDVNLLDGGDRLTADTSLPVTVDGGNGADTIATGSGADTIDGGNGKDTVDYSARTAPVSVTPDGVADDGEAGEGDNVGADVENVVGGSAGDVLHAGPAGGTVSGGAGDDQLFGGPGEDKLVCGDGLDSATAGADDAVDSSCEQATGGSDAADGSSAPTVNATDPTPAPDIVLPVRPVTLGAPGVVNVHVGCDVDAADGCRGDIYLEVPARFVVRAARGHYVAQQRRSGSARTGGSSVSIGHRKFAVAAGKTLDTQVRLALRGHYVLRNHRRIRGRIRIVERDAAGKVLGTTTRPVVLDRKWARKGIRHRRH